MMARKPVDAGAGDKRTASALIKVMLAIAETWYSLARISA